MNKEKLGAAPQMYAGGDAKQAIEFAWPKGAGWFLVSLVTVLTRGQSCGYRVYGRDTPCCYQTPPISFVVGGGGKGGEGVSEGSSQVMTFT